MPAGISKAKGRRNSKTRNSGFSRDKVGLPAKAGKRKPPANRGPHVTTEETRKRGAFLSALGLRPYTRPIHWRQPHEMA